MPLPSLPTELIEHIATYLDIASSRSFRLSCTSLSQQSLHLFRERFFRTRTLQWAKPCFDALLEITAHVDFGDALQHLVIDATPVHSIRLWQLRCIYDGSKSIGRSELIPPELTTTIEDYQIINKVAEEAATFFNETRYDQKCLKAVFETLRNRGCGALESILFAYKGTDKKYGKFGRRYCEFSQHEMSRPFVSTMTAIASSKLQVNTVSMPDIYQHGAVSIGRLESLAPSLRNLDFVFEHMQVLKLNLRDWRYPDSGFELDSDRAPFVVRFLAKAHNVKELELSCYSSLQDNVFGELARHCTFPNLETCKLSMFCINAASDVLAFLSPSNATLRSLTLNHIRLIDEHVSWPQLLVQFASSTSILAALEYLKLANVFTRTGPRMCLNVYVTTTMEFGGEGRVPWREQLKDDHGGLHEGISGPAWALGAVAYPFIWLRM